MHVFRMASLYCVASFMPLFLAELVTGMHYFVVSLKKSTERLQLIDFKVFLLIYKALNGL